MSWLKFSNRLGDKWKLSIPGRVTFAAEVVPDGPRGFVASIIGADGFAVARETRPDLDSACSWAESQVAGGTAR